MYRMALESGKLDYKINSLTNVTEIYSSGFNITLPSDSRLLASGIRLELGLQDLTDG